MVFWLTAVHIEVLLRLQGLVHFDQVRMLNGMCVQLCMGLGGGLNILAGSLLSRLGRKYIVMVTNIWSKSVGIRSVRIARPSNLL